MPAGGWRYFAMRLGDGAMGEFLDWDLPLQGVGITDTLSGHNSLNATISPEIPRLVADDGQPLLEEWTTAIFAENEGVIRGGGIVTHSGFKGHEWSIECTGYTGYLEELPYTGARFFVEADPLDIYRHIWAHVQAQPGGNLGFEIGKTKSGLKIGTELEQVEFDTQAGPVSFESGPYKLAWYQTHDLAEDQNKLANETPFDWHERHFWDGDTLRHVLDIGYPKIGRRRNDLRFVIGENLHIIPDIERDGEDYATEALVLGSGEGAKMIRGSSSRPRKGLRRVAVVVDPSIRSLKRANSRAEQEMAWRATLDDIGSVIVQDTTHAPVGSIQPGDEIRIQGRTGWKELDVWVTVLSMTINPQNGEAMQLSVRRSDRLAA